tara:strand:+ start:19876 stop:20394 length:519 start_codon:yes stop_codon:yes gene_type:complete
MLIRNKKKGILFWITGLSGSGKSTISKKIYTFIKEEFGPTIILSGDDLRSIFLLNKYDYKSRIKYLKFYHKFCKKITNQNINVIFSVVGLSHKIRALNKKKIQNYIEIYIKSELKKIKKKKFKKIYTKNVKNIWGVDLTPEFPKNPTITINNNFKRSTQQMADLLIKKIKKV